MPAIVLVDDDALYREAVSAELADRGFDVTCFGDAASLLKGIEDGATADIVLLDWALPGMSGLELLGRLREQEMAPPIVFLTGYSEVERELQALGRGAVDFIDKARGVEVLVYRLRVIIEARRHTPAEAKPQIERHGDLSLRSLTARAFWKGRDIGLTTTEYKILVTLVSHTGQSQTYRRIYDIAHYAGFIAGSGEGGHKTNVRSLIKRIRRKFLTIDPNFSEIENLPSIGYRWRAPNGSAAGQGEKAIPPTD